MSVYIVIITDRYNVFRRLQDQYILKSKAQYLISNSPPFVLILSHIQVNPLYTVIPCLSEVLIQARSQLVTIEDTNNFENYAFLDYYAACSGNS
jgi:hypothetical protein